MRTWARAWAEAKFSSEGPARRGRFSMMDDPLPFTGHDKRAPPNHFSEGPARQVRFCDWRDVLVTSVYWDWGGTSFSTRNKHSQRSPVGAIHELALPGSECAVLAIHELPLSTCRFALMNVFWARFMNRPYQRRRDPLVGSVYQRSIMNSVSAGTEVPRGKRG